jgi:hypothetical protein
MLMMRHAPMARAGPGYRHGEWIRKGRRPLQLGVIEQTVASQRQFDHKQTKIIELCQRFISASV